MQCYAGHLLEAALWFSTWQLPQAPKIRRHKTAFCLEATAQHMRSTGHQKLSLWVAVQPPSWT